MKHRKLGPSDLEVSEISLGWWLTFFRWRGAVQTRACTDAAFETGLNFLTPRALQGSHREPVLADLSRRGVLWVGLAWR
jgi:hypothetical protein